MPDRSFVQNTVSQLVEFIVPASAGGNLTGLVFNTASLIGYYYREGAAAPVAITLVTMTAGTWTSGGFVSIDGTHMPGLYQLGIPNAALASGAKFVVIMLSGAVGMNPASIFIDLTVVDQYATNFNITGNLAGSVGSVVGAVGSVTGSVGSVTGNVGGNLLGTLTTTERTAIGTALLKLDWTTVTGEAARSCLNALRLLRNKWSIAASTMTITKEDDSTAAWTAALTVDGAAQPITSSDPT